MNVLCILYSIQLPALFLNVNKREPFTCLCFRLIDPKKHNNPLGAKRHEHAECDVTAQNYPDAGGTTCLSSCQLHPENDFFPPSNK